MKKLKLFSFFIVITLCLTNTQCHRDDDYYSQEFYVDNNQLVEIDNNTVNFNINESIVIETNISNQQTTESGQDILLTNYYYEDFDPKTYRYSLTLYKENAFGTISKIPLTLDSISSIEGETAVLSGNAYVSCIYDGTSFKNKFSINLPEAGTFYLASERFLSDNNGELRISGGIYELGNVNINTIIVNANANGAYEFTVN
ncbi:hypothetical protein [uncultured Lacinutrix sp.]|uniref:hypothetical protein n=1 Tax=uncultured Lacinutrix sp. TaxID=574032 RepID=UPI002605A566|nr:hypothetical protein [uncultured Lacinutrix sp.]